MGSRTKICLTEVCLALSSLTVPCVCVCALMELFYEFLRTAPPHKHAVRGDGLCVFLEWTRVHGTGVQGGVLIQGL